MKWSNKQIKEHIKAAKVLEKTAKEAFDYIKNSGDAHEYDAAQFILKQFKKYKIKIDRPPIVAFSENTQYVHYFPSQYSKKIKPESLIMIDLWGRINKKSAPFADITVMGYYGKKIPAEVLKIFNIVIKARDKAVRYLKKCLKQGKMPTGFEIDKIARDYIKKEGYGDNFLHGLGHPLGFTNPHGAGVRLSPKFKKPLLKMVGYTIEPGVYIKNKFGIRSEIDFYINEKNRVVITTKVQREILKV
jgi:Xaa-Pro aminopeptidase